MYNVGVGDCIYLRIPDGGQHVHVLIDCGTIGSIKLLKAALADIKEQLPPVEGEPQNKRLDLLVATHRHRDHIKGFDPEFFEGIRIGHIWMSAVMNPDHPQASRSLQLHQGVSQAMRSLEASGQALSPEMQLLASMYSIGNDGAVEALRSTLPAANQIQPRYVVAGQTGQQLGLHLQDTQIKVLGPEENIDFYYLGDETAADFVGLSVFDRYFKPKALKLEHYQPHNISISELKMLQNRILSDPLGFAEKDSSIQNNSSVVLLFEWRGRRLLFVADAEWEGEFAEGKHNGAWNVMWQLHRDELSQPLDFLKIGHHGSFNATPWRPDKPASNEVNQILDAVLPLPAVGESPAAAAIVSTLRTNVYKPIPSAQLLAELGRRVHSTRNYAQALAALPDFDLLTDLPLPAYEQAFLHQPQPLRTDLEMLLTGDTFVEVAIDPAN